MRARSVRRPGDELRVGSRVRYRMPGGAYEATVVEDLGDLGVNGRRLLMIQPLSEYADGPFMWPAEELLPTEDRDLDERVNGASRHDKEKTSSPR